MKTKKPHTHGPLFSDVHSCLEKEFENADITVNDDENTATARAEWENDKNYQTTMKLVGALCFQLRYRESLPFCEELYHDNKEDFALNRRLGVLYFKLLEFDKSLKHLYFCLENVKNDNKVEILSLSYIIAVVHYYNQQFERAKFYLEKCVPLCVEDGEMYVAVLYWYRCCLSMLKEPKKEFVNFAKDYDFDCGHHTGYDAFVRFAMGLISEEDAINACESDTELNKTCLFYGLSAYYVRDKKKSSLYLDKMLSYKELFGGFSYIAGYVDFKKTSAK